MWTLRRHSPPLLPRATAIVSALRRHDRANHLRDGRRVGWKSCKRDDALVDDDRLEAGFYAKCRAGRDWPDRTVAGQPSADALVQLSTTIALSWATLSENRVETAEYKTVFLQMSTLTLRTLLSWTWMTRPLWDEKWARTAQQTCHLAHTSSLRFVNRKLTERVLIVTVSCHRGLFQQSLFGTEARVFHDGDADVHEGMCTDVVLSGETTMSQDIGERMPLKRFGLDKQAHCTLGGTSVRRGDTWTFFRLFLSRCEWKGQGPPRSGSQVQQVRCSCTESRQDE